MIFQTFFLFNPNSESEDEKRGIHPEGERNTQ